MESGICWSTEATEYMTARLGLLKAHELGLKMVVIEGDCRELISYFSGDSLSLVYQGPCYEL